MSFSVISQIFGLFVNTLTDHDKYSLRKSDNLLQPIQMHIYLSNIKTFPDICSTLFLKSKSSFEHFEKRMTLIAYVFPKFGISKDVVR